MLNTASENVRHGHLCIQQNKERNQENETYHTK